ncbi:Esterase EstA precursor [Ruegeria atlantica]|uniref:Esterase EstA n=1 Tax=Ruegeria atlantica TaxID=81569 RepID=A0A0P1EP95_9RHOB|nr:Esterase EstA precursor [Ruegeria atlantica]
MSGLGIGGFRTRESIAFSRSIYGSWENVFFGSARTDGGKTALDAFAFRDPGPTDNVSATLLFDRLTLENTSLTIRDGASSDGRQTGQIVNLSLGFGGAGVGRGGGLTLRNSDLIFRDGTRLVMNSPDGGPAFIRAESGTNELRLGSNNIISVPLTVDVAAGAQLDLVGTTLEPFLDSWLTVGQGATLQLRSNAVLGLTKSNGSATPSSEITGGTLRLEGSGTELQLTDPRITDGSVSINTGALFRVQDSNNAASALTFAGNSTLRFESATSTLAGSVTAPNDLTVNVLGGTTAISSASLLDIGAGLRASNIAVDQGTLDISGLSAQTDFYDNLSALSLANGATFFDAGSQVYTGLDTLDVDGSTLRSLATFGSFSAPGGQMVASFNNSTIDLFGALPPTSGIAPGLANLRLNANQARFTGDNQVRIGISPSGECVLSGGSCVPGTTRFSGQLITNVAGTAPVLTGFDTLFFVPLATDATASSTDYINGGNNGVYTVALNNPASGLPGTTASYDAAPRTPTAFDFTAAGSTLPANLLYSIVNDPVADDQVDIAFIDVSLINNPFITPSYTPQTTTSVVTNPNTGNQTTTTVVTTPSGNGATQTVTTTIRAPGGGLISTNTVTNTLGPATGTTNTQNLGQLVSNSGGTLPYNALPQVSTLHPEAYASFMTVALEQSDLRRNMVLSNANGRATGNGRIEGVTAEGRNVWFDAGLTRGDVDADGGLAGFDYDLNQFILGADVWSDERSRAGVYVGYGTYSMSDHTTSADTLDLSSDEISIGAYGVLEKTDWSFSGMAGVSLGDVDATRDAIVGSTANRHTASYDSKTFEFAIRAEYTALPTRNGWHLAPEVGLGYAYYDQDGFIEDGDPMTALTVEDATADSLIGSLGVNVTGPAFAGGLVPIGFLRYEHDFLAASDDTHDIDASLAASPGVSQSFVGTHRGENAISVGLGFGTVIGASVDASAGVVYQRNSNGDEIGGGARITWRF